MSTHSHLVVHHGPRSIPLGDGHDSSAIGRWFQWSISDEAILWSPAATVGLKLVHPPARDERADILAAQGAAMSKRIDEDILTQAINPAIWSDELKNLWQKELVHTAWLNND